MLFSKLILGFLNLGTLCSHLLYYIPYPSCILCPMKIILIFFILWLLILYLYLCTYTLWKNVIFILKLENLKSPTHHCSLLLPLSAVLQSSAIRAIIMGALYYLFSLLAFQLWHAMTVTLVVHQTMSIGNQGAIYWTIYLQQVISAVS